MFEHSHPRLRNVLTAIGVAAFSVLSALGETAEAKIDRAAELENAVQMMRDAILGDIDTVIVGQIRADGSFRDAEPGVKADVSAVLSTLRLQRVFVTQVLRSSRKVPDVIYLQAHDSNTVAMRRGGAADLLEDDRMRIFLVKPGEKLTEAPLILPSSHDFPEPEILRFRKAVTPLKMFEKLGISSRVNLNSWWSLYDGIGAIAVNCPKPTFAPLRLAEPQRARTLALAQERADTHYFERLLHPLILEGEFVEDLRQLLHLCSAEMFTSQTDKKPPVSAAATSALYDRLREFRPRAVSETGKKLTDAILQDEKLVKP